jgi:hypothetical protein
MCYQQQPICQHPLFSCTAGNQAGCHPSLLADPSPIPRDTAGQERYLSLAPLYYRGAHAAAIVYAVDSRDTFEKARYWVDQLQKNASGSIRACGLTLAWAGGYNQLSERIPAGKQYPSAVRCSLHGLLPCGKSEIAFMTHAVATHR